MIRSIAKDICHFLNWVILWCEIFHLRLTTHVTLYNLIEMWISSDVNEINNWTRDLIHEVNATNLDFNFTLSQMYQSREIAGKIKKISEKTIRIIPHRNWNNNVVSHWYFVAYYIQWIKAKCYKMKLGCMRISHGKGKQVMPSQEISKEFFSNDRKGITRNYETINDKKK